MMSFILSKSAQLQILFVAMHQWLSVSSFARLCVQRYNIFPYSPHISPKKIAASTKKGAEPSSTLRLAIQSLESWGLACFLICICLQTYGSSLQFILLFQVVLKEIIFCCSRAEYAAECLMAVMALTLFGRLGLCDELLGVSRELTLQQIDAVRTWYIDVYVDSS
jgi:hypothetical protein